MSLYHELKRRNVIRVAIAYAIAAWLLIEVYATTSPRLMLPDWAAAFVTVMLMIGFPVALIFAWAFEMTPEGIKKEKDVDRSKSMTSVTSQKLNNVIIGVLVLALAYFAIDKFILAPGRAQPGSEPFSQQPSGQTTDINEKRALTPIEAGPNSVEANPEVSQQSIAVLPFVNMSSDPEQEYFSDGIAEEILNVLVRIEDLKVASRTTSWGFKGQEALGIPFIAHRTPDRQRADTIAGGKLPAGYRAG